MQYRMFCHHRQLVFVAVLVALAARASAFTTPFLGSPRSLVKSCSSRAIAGGVGTMSMRVVEVNNEEAFDATLKQAGSSLVVVDYSTTWCGPCKVIAPKFEELSDKYKEAVFLKVSGEYLE